MSDHRGDPARAAGAGSGIGNRLARDGYFDARIKIGLFELIPPPHRVQPSLQVKNLISEVRRGIAMNSMQSGRESISRRLLVPRFCALAPWVGAGILAMACTNFAFAQDTLRVSVDSTGKQANRDSSLKMASISGNGQVVAFTSYAFNLVSGDTNKRADVYVHDRSTGLTERVSVDSSGVGGNDASYDAAIAADGNVVAFTSAATNLVPGDTNAKLDVFVHDRTTGITECVSVTPSGAVGNGSSGPVLLSADGRLVAFQSLASNLVSGDSNNRGDVFVRDRSTGSTELVSVNRNGTQGNDESVAPAISADGQTVAFSSNATNLDSGDTNQLTDVFVHDRTTGDTVRVSLDSSGAQANGNSYVPSLSLDGQIVAFTSDASNLISNDANSAFDAFVHDRKSGVTERVSVDSSGAEGSDLSSWVEISADGMIATFSSLAPNLVASDTNGVGDVFVHDRRSGTTERVSVDSSGAQGNDSSWMSSISADGSTVAFSSSATNLVPHDTNLYVDIFVHELCSQPASWSNYGAGFPGTNGVPAFTARQNPVLGAALTLDLSDSSGAATVGLLLVGFQRTSIHTGFGGDLLVLPALLAQIAIPATGATFDGTLPHDDRLCGFTVDLQALEADPGAAKGVSFTAGLELVLGH